MKANVIRNNQGALRRIIERMAGLNQQVEVGVPKGAMHGGGISMSLLANIHTYGSFSRGIPARPFLQPALQENQDKYIKYLKSQTMPLLFGRAKQARVLGLLGEMATADVKKYFTSGRFAPLAASTIKAKGSSRPLIDTGQLRQSITYSIERR